MDAKRKNRSVNSCAVLKNIKNFESKVNTIVPRLVPKPIKKKNRELRNLEAELGVERYKNRLLAEEISQKKGELQYSRKLEEKLKGLETDYDLLVDSIERSNVIQQRQQSEIENLKKTLNMLRNCKQ